MDATIRNEELKAMLTERRQEIKSELDRYQAKDQPETEPNGEVDLASDESEVDIQEDIEFALIQMKAETLAKIESALERLEQGTYGLCAVCHTEIAQPRLRALPFAVRCKDCEEAKEVERMRERREG